MLSLNIDATGALAAVRELKQQLTSVNIMGNVLKVIADHIWIRDIIDKFLVSQSQSNYRDELNSTMASLDPEFVRKLSGTPSAAWAQRTEEERRGEYARMGVTDDIIDAIDASEPIKRGDKILIIGIGDVDKLNKLTQIGNTRFQLWQLLEYGTGVYGTAHRPVLRIERQIFYDRNNRKKGVLTYLTLNPGSLNPGFRGRHAFMDVAGHFYGREDETVRTLLKYFNQVIANLSYKGK